MPRGGAESGPGVVGGGWWGTSCMRQAGGGACGRLRRVALPCWRWLSCSGHLWPPPPAPPPPPAATTLLPPPSPPSAAAAACCPQAAPHLCMPCFPAPGFTAQKRGMWRSSTNAEWARKPSMVLGRLRRACGWRAAPAQRQCSGVWRGPGERMAVAQAQQPDSQTARQRAQPTCAARSSSSASSRSAASRAALCPAASAAACRRLAAAAARGPSPSPLPGLPSPPVAAPAARLAAASSLRSGASVCRHHSSSRSFSAASQSAAYLQYRPGGPASVRQPIGCKACCCLLATSSGTETRQAADPARQPPKRAPAPPPSPPTPTPTAA